MEKYLKYYKIEAIVTAIQTAWEMQSVKTEAKLKFHPDTSLLIVYGTPGELEVVESTLHRLSHAEKK
jgi:hypothetical protein